MELYASPVQSRQAGEQAKATVTGCESHSIFRRHYSFRLLDSVKVQTVRSTGPH